MYQYRYTRLAAKIVYGYTRLTARTAAVCAPGRSVLELYRQ